METEERGVAAAMAAAAVLASTRGQNAESPAQMRVYLDKLRDLVPQCPKNRNVSKLELIQHVIDYITDLQDTLQGEGVGEYSPPLSPAAEHEGTAAAGFNEAFSQLTFDDYNITAGDESHASQSSSVPNASYHCYRNGNIGYSSAASSDYDSRGSSPVNHSDTDYSSDDYTYCTSVSPTISCKSSFTPSTSATYKYTTLGDPYVLPHTSPHLQYFPASSASPVFFNSYNNNVLSQYPPH